MKHVVILGPGAAAKSTLAAQLGENTGLPAIELDQLFWQPDPAADTVTVLDFCLIRCAWRAIRHSTERLDFWLWLFRYRRRKPTVSDKSD